MGADLVKHLKELGAGLVDGADDGAAALGQGPHEGDHLEAGGAVQAAAAGDGEQGREEGAGENRQGGDDAACVQGLCGGLLSCPWSGDSAPTTPWPCWLLAHPTMPQLQSLPNSHPGVTEPGRP